MSQYVGAIDQGTTSTRFIVVDKLGRIVSAAQREHRQIYPNPGWVEHDPEEIWTRTQEVIAQAMDQKGLRPADLAAIGITNQRETVVLWNRKTGRPVYNAIVWQDTRVEDAVAEFSKTGTGQDRFRDKTGLPLATYFSGLKIRWILNNVPEAEQLAHSGDLLFGNIDTFLLWRLTGGVKDGIHATDVTNASRTQLMNLQNLSWDKAMLDAFAIPEHILPKILSSSQIYGRAKTALILDVPIGGILGDQQAALVGQACFEPGQTKNTYGTGCFLLMNTGSSPVLSRHGLISTVAYKFGESPAQYALEGSIAITGALVQWLRDNFSLIEKSADIETLARTVRDNSGVYLVPAFSGLYAPYWLSSARGVIVGLTLHSNKGHLARAALEATAYQTREVLEAMEMDSKVNVDVLQTDGGMVDNDLLMQFQADILNRNIVRPLNKEVTAAGACYAAGLAVGFYKSLDEIRANWQLGRVWKPEMGSVAREYLFQQWKKAVTRSFDWIS